MPGQRSVQDAFSTLLREVGVFRPVQPLELNLLAACGPPPSVQPSLLPMAQPSVAPASFEAALAELEAIVVTMEGGQLPLAESLAAYQRGAVLLQYCQTTLKDAELQVEVLEKGVLKAFESAGRDGRADDDES
jgi:exodeoxyribonuclease VII small subunit